MQLEKILAQAGELIEYKKGDIIFAQGKFDDYLYNVKQGCLKAYYITDSGKEYVKSFIIENDFIASLSSYRSPDENCKYSLVCLEKSVLLRLKLSHIFKIIEQEPTLAVHIFDMLINILLKKEQREFEFLCLSAEERYFQIKQYRPELFNRATQYDIAGYLGITPVALSRIKTRTAKMTV
ncbi:cAMP-binding proteins - catabolite gene activator and regulatory subunit of cAMP-dependent protein kinases [hydrothermal vent metagenome]|uniref:cAMP-binding proteins - catabolite gene activator and regulatory subunit of cAMP-dependent protein kinases n=1 Tax=hydrothermal vent metagenome TaxID=652676 RepID=A0A3B0YQ61_9ZZZZ